MLVPVASSSVIASPAETVGRQPRPPVFQLPCSLRTQTLLPPELHECQEEALYFIDLLVRKTAAGKTNRHEYVRLMAEHLRKIMGYTTYAKIILALIQREIVERSNYVPGKHSRGYRLAERLRADRVWRYQPRKPRLLSALVRAYDQSRKKQASRELEIHRSLNAAQYRFLTIIKQEADAILDSLPARVTLSQDALVHNLLHRSLTNSITRTGRWCNALTCIKRELRAALRIADEQMASVDLCCAQPALLAWLIRQLSPSVGPATRTAYIVCPGVVSVNGLCILRLCVDEDWFRRGDLAAFDGLVVSGRLYARLMDLTGLDRQRVKREFMAAVLAPKRWFPSAVDKAFAKEFPTVTRIIRLINRDDHRTLICTLQRLESWLVIQRVCPLLVNVCPIVPLHDAIYCRPGDVGQVQAAFETVFSNLGFWMQLKVEQPSSLVTSDRCGRPPDTVSGEVAPTALRQLI